MMHNLEAPNEFARAGAQSNNRVGPFIVALPDAAVIIGAGAASGDENEVALGIHRESGPGVAGASARCGLIGPRRDGIPSPTELAGAHVEGANNSALHGDRAIVAHRRAGNDEVFKDGGG